ncbi:adenosylcobinamide-GDP ribazoletransferase [Nonomuraea rhodomycinica]|uniref:Adenosylcobinamide-GDP ribazoletransferase n=1 Tax=Nonomuraea rhodomycinica TaxID=1712872 RepID=A0A7Y6IKS2_9ACTN|nr:adenosylcobinamide-GDP ribazoletransferase [Nonomuraea rhodomycinica]NUW40049.1 adenosylcobinamide-GDP ribazoletransferase [Nonomuraea rhodomycinica]
MRLRGGSPGSSPAGAGRTDGLRLAVGLLTIFPVRVGRVDRRTAGAAMGLAPVVGLVLGLVACLPLLLPGPPLLGAALAVGALAVLTRGLHLDGLADLADGLGSGKPADQALDIMKKSDIGPFGVMTLVITLLVQIAALAAAGPYALVTACVTGRLALVWACRSGVPAARPGGLGATVAGTVRPATAWLVTAAALVVATPALVVAPVAMAAGLGAALLLLRRARRRLGGVTGDVLGALVETATTAALVVWAVSG